MDQLWQLALYNKQCNIVQICFSKTHIHYCIQRLCREPHTLGKGSLALGKGLSAHLLSAKRSLLRVIHRALGKGFAESQT